MPSCDLWRRGRRSALVVALLVMLAACGQTSPQSPGNNLKLIENARQSGLLTVVEFGSDTCASCRRMKIVMDAVAQRTQGRAHVLIMDVVKDGSLPQPFRISMIPTQVFFDARGREVWRHMGPLTEAQVLERLAPGS